MHEKKHGFRYCSVCKSKLQKRGSTAAGTPRWQCPVCVRSSTRPRSDLSRRYTFERFITWLLGKDAQHELPQPSRTFRDQTVWCWGVAPPFVLSGETRQTIIVDGIRVGDQLCLIARTKYYVIAWLWVPRENSHYWAELFRLLPQPKYVVCDGQKGLLKALAVCWPTAIVQRCRFHTWLNTKSKLTLRPESQAGKELLELSRALLSVRTRRQARRWKRRLKYWYRKHAAYITARTVNPDPQPRQRSWRYTHERTRSAYRQLSRLSNDLLRCSYRPHPDLCATTNHVEGGINSQLRTKLKLHRGMPPAHQMRLVDWYLYSRTEDPKPPQKCL